MILSDRTIKEEISKKRIIIEPYEESMVQPSSIDVHLGDEFLVFNNTDVPFVDLKKPLEYTMTKVKVEENKPFILHPGEFVLGATDQRIALPNNIAARIEGKSSLGRIGLLIHSTAGFIDPGWDGQITLELSNVSRLPITLYPKMKIGQISFHMMSTEVDNPYGSSKLGSKYQGQRGPQPSKYYQNFTI